MNINTNAGASSSSIFLSLEEVYQLTGRRQKSKQVKQLQDMKIPHTVDCIGRPKVLKAVVLDGLGGSSSNNFDNSIEKQTKINLSPMPQ